MYIYKNDIEKILREAGKVIMSYRDKYNESFEKEKNEIVTPADIASNNFISKELSRLYPDIPIYSEENQLNDFGKTRWIVDPLDGTTPWVWGNSGFSISIALEKNGEVIVGAVYDPIMKELFYAERNKGAFLNNKSIKVSTETDVSKMFLVIDWGNKDEKRKEGLGYFEKFLLPDMFARRIVPQFAPALGLCHIAEGRIHGLICNDTWVEDHSAGALILRESGGFVTNFYDKSSFNHRESGIIATNNVQTHEKITQILK